MQGLRPSCEHTLYDPWFEHDACGVGMVCCLQGEPSHDIVEMGLTILHRLDHRGARGADSETGDGAGILMDLPDAFFRMLNLSFSLPPEGTYGAGLVFLPHASEARQRARSVFSEKAQQLGLQLLGWREVPVHPERIGEAARLAMPVIEQVFVARGKVSPEHFEAYLYLYRKAVEQEVPEVYICSLSSRTIVYKGMLTVEQVPRFFEDLNHPTLASRFALVHSRFSTNTLPEWSLAQPFRYLCHNGEINTLRGNINWMRAREALLHHPVWGKRIEVLHPIIREGQSDSATLDNVLELLHAGGRSLPHAMMMLIPEAWEQHPTMDEARRAFYAYHACMMEPWDGPAVVLFSDGRYCGGVLDRNGFRPGRFSVTDDGLVVLASEAGVLDLDPARVIRKGRLQPGRMFLVDLKEGRIVEDEEIKQRISTRRPYGAWLSSHLITESRLPRPLPQVETFKNLTRQLRLFGYSMEDLRMTLFPMARQGKEPIGSMGNDTPLAVLSHRPRLLYDYFKQLFAQVTNPPLDAIREEVITAMHTYLGPQQNLFEETPEHARRIRLEHPILTGERLAQIRALEKEDFPVAVLETLFPVAQGGRGLEAALHRLCQEAEEAVRKGAANLILSDRGTSKEMAPIPALLATAAVHHHLIRKGLRMQCGLIVESGEPREVHHFATLLTYGAQAIYPYLAMEVIREHVREGKLLHSPEEEETDLHWREEEAVQRYIKAINKGVLKVMSKMGISTLQSYCGAQIMEALGLAEDLVERYFTGTPSRIGGISLEEIAEDVRRRHAQTFPRVELPFNLPLHIGGMYQWRRMGEAHAYRPMVIARLQHAVQQKNPVTYAEYAEMVNNQAQQQITLRGLLDFAFEKATPIPLEEVEPWTAIVKRFKTGAMSYGSISKEAHETLAIAMNRLGGRSNTGEGGEDPERYAPNHPARSRIKQVASGRFGVTIGYLASADEIQIKMAQGAKPGEGGQLPGKKVYPWIARTRHSTPWVGLISPPPHHDIYSIEDLAQLIYDLKNSNPQARINVKLVAEVGVGTIAAGVAKGKADVILISGHDGGTGASPQTSIYHAGLPWELGLSETHQVLVMNGLRNRVKLECDGHLKTGRDVAIAALLGADEFGFATAPLVAMGCIMMRKCHLNTCPVGIATQDPELRKKFMGKPEHVINFFYFVAEELRQIMAQLGFRTVDEMVGRVDMLKVREDIVHPRARKLDLSRILTRVETPPALRKYDVHRQAQDLDRVLDQELIAEARPALEHGQPVHIRRAITNADRTVGTMLSWAVARRYGERGLPDDTIRLTFEGSAGQSFAAFGARGLTFHLIGEANDYFGKGLSGARLIVTPPENLAAPTEESIVVGNVALYGATSGEVFIRGMAGERFAVRNSGAHAVVEGVGDHGCEYMTGGRVVILGPTGRNFAAGMSGGIAYVLDMDGHFADHRCNLEMVELYAVTESADIEELRRLIEAHLHYTGSDRARDILEHWSLYLPRFIKVFPTDYRLALEKMGQPEVYHAA